MEPEYRLTISCPDGVGIVGTIGQFISSHGGWITEANHYSDTSTGQFFMRHCIRPSSLPLVWKNFVSVCPIAEKICDEMENRRFQRAEKVILMASKESHCLVDLLHRWHSKELHCDIPCVISNHDTLRSLVQWHGIPFFHVPVDSHNKEEHFRRVNALVEEHAADTIVLARYMQIIPPELCARYKGQVINIHHSFCLLCWG